MNKFITYGKQYIDRADKLSVLRTLSKDIITTGDEVNNFEKKIKRYLKCNYATVCNSGTSAIFLALGGIDLKKNDVVVMPAINFIASYNISKFYEAKIYLADVDKITGQMTPQNVIDCCKKFKINKIKAIITMHHGGYPINTYSFFKLKKKFGCYIIEDSCHALGATYQSKEKKIKIGSCNHADISTFSLHPLKTITTGEGGIVTTNSKIINNKLKMMRSHGITRKKNHWEYDVKTHGLNLRLNDFQCSLGISQLKKINKFILKRKKISNLYDKYLKESNDIRLIEYSKKIKPSYHLYIIHLNNGSISLKNKFIKFMLKKKIYIQYHYIPIYKFTICNEKEEYKNSEKYYNTALSLPIHYGLTKIEQMYVIKNIFKFFKSKN